jgi:hypothetical protein
MYTHVNIDLEYREFFQLNPKLLTILFFMSVATKNKMINVENKTQQNKETSW